MTLQPVSSTLALRWFGFGRLALGSIFLWAFIDKVFGFGFATEAGKAWIDGVSPTTGFLKFATSGPLKDFYAGLAGVAVIDWVYMIGLGAIGIALMTGLGLKIAGWSGALMMLLFWSAALPPEHHPFVDDHIVYIFFLGAIARQPELFSYFSLQTWWSKQGLVIRHPSIR